MTETSSTGTSTMVVFTGQTVSRDGGPQARADAQVAITAHVTLTAATISKYAAVKAGAMTFSAKATNDTTKLPIPHEMDRAAAELPLRCSFRTEL